MDFRFTAFREVRSAKEHQSQPKDGSHRKYAAHNKPATLLSVR
jgi:hypothetical protein